MNYIFEGNINFYDELKKELMEINEDNKEMNDNKEIKDTNTNIKNDDENDDEKCLITNEHLTIHYITLPCHHKFNYIPLYKTIVLQKKKNINYLESNTILPKQIQCPYCRCKHNNLLPYIPLEDIARVLYVNSPSVLSINYKMCQWVYKGGKKKNMKCNHNAYYDITNNSNINTLLPSELNKLVSYCSIHWSKYNKDKNSAKELNEFEWTNEMAELFNSNTVTSLKEKLRKANLKLVGNKKELIKRYINWYKNPQ
jgi:hypothetical protein